MILDDIRARLFSMQDTGYRGFQAKLLPTVFPEKIIGVRTPQLRAFAKEIAGRSDFNRFLESVPHEYFDENQLHAFAISGIKDFGECLSETERFLPFIDNWATCDQLSPKVFRKNPGVLLEKIGQWISSSHVYTVRFGVGLLMQHFLDDGFSPAYPEMVSKIVSDEYYVNMMVAWYFATALAKQYDAVFPFIRERRLPVWVHNKSIQKALESFRVSDGHKATLRAMKIVARKKNGPVRNVDGSGETKETFGGQL
ncbi:MAG: DNA alkylation repair protein [Treponema sp.]|nr:DNA alkylation repair protein [Treponema sp.]